MQILCDSIKIISKHNIAPRDLHIYIKNNAKHEDLDELKKILYNEKGDTAVVLLINGSKEIRLPVKVNPSSGLINKKTSLS